MRKWLTIRAANSDLKSEHDETPLEPNCASHRLHTAADANRARQQQVVSELQIKDQKASSMR